MGDNEIEDTIQKIASFPEVFSYKVPPLDASGFRAEKWGLETPYSTGPMVILTKGDVALIKLTSPEKGIVAQISIDLDLDQSKPESQLDYYLDQAKDSSRYFVLRMVDPKSNKKALLGIGFRERESAFEFRESLIHHFNRVRRWRGIKEKAVEETSGDLPVPDFAESADSFESDSSNVMKTSTAFSAVKLTGPIKLNIPSKKYQIPSSAPVTVNTNDEEWGDFQG